MGDDYSGHGVPGLSIPDPGAYLGQLQNKCKRTVECQDGVGPSEEPMDLKAAALDPPLLDEPDANAASIFLSPTWGVVLLVHHLMAVS